MAEPSNRLLTQRYLKYPIKTMYYLGLWKSQGASISYICYAVFVLFFTQYLYAIFQVIYMVDVWGDIEKIAEASFLLLTQATLCIKIILYVVREKDVKRLAAFMDGDIFRPVKPHHKTIVYSSATIQTVEYFIFLVMTSSTIALWAVFPLIDAGPEEKVLPFKAWYPIPNDQSPYYEILYFYQIAGIWLSASINVSIDRLSTAMTAAGCAQIEVLKDNLKNIEAHAIQEFMTTKFKSMNKSNVHEAPTQRADKYSRMDVSILQREDFIEIDRLIEINLIRCIKHHKHIVDFVKDVENSFHYGILAQFAASVGIICVTGLQITLIEPKSLKFATKVLYLVAMLAQIFFICRIGNDISFISGGLVEAAYVCPWIVQKKRFKTTLLIFMERLKQPIITRAGNFFPLSLATFVALVRLSYSYFAVLQQLNAK